MDQITLNAYAKINLSLEVLRRRPDGYHDILSFMQGIDLSDIITARARSEAVNSFRNEQEGRKSYYSCIIDHIKVQFRMDDDTIPMDSRNLAFQGAEAVIHALPSDALCPEAVQLMVHKRLPIAAGIAGGSGNAAGCMLAMNALCGYPLSMRELMTIGAAVGADVPFSLMMNARKNAARLEGLPGLEEASEAAWIRGIGEIVEPVRPKSYAVILMNPGIAVSTREVYEAIDAAANGIVNDALFYNRMEAYTLTHYPEAAALRRAMLRHLHADHVVMSGSGPTMVAYYEDRAAAQRDYRAACAADWRQHWNIWCTDSGGK